MQVIVIGGPSGSGKTTLSSRILKKIKNGIILSTDNYYKTGLLSKLLSLLVENYFDRSISFNKKLFKNDFNYILNNGKSNHKYEYDFKNKTIKKSRVKINNINYLILEGIFTSELIPKIYNHNCFIIELKTNKSSCLKRVINRDVIERGKSPKHAESDFLKSWEIYHSKNKKNYSKKEFKRLIISENQDMDFVFSKILNLMN